jgi:hypothetical protein
MYLSIGSKLLKGESPISIVVEPGEYEDICQSDRLESRQLNRFCSDLNLEIQGEAQRHGLDDESDLKLYGVGGAQAMMYHLGMDERRANDLDYMISHTNHPQDELSFREAKVVHSAFENLGFEFTTGAEDRRYDPRVAGCQTLSNEEGTRNGLPITNLDLMAGQKPLGKYPISWVEEYSELVSDNLGILSLEATAVRKIFRNTVDYQGREDGDQRFDIGKISGYVEGQPERFDTNTFEDSWEDLLEANPDKKKPASEAKTVLKQH